jgi:hypothetical protein
MPKENDTALAAQRRQESQSAPDSTPQQTARQVVQLDDSEAAVGYCNFCRVTGTPEEVVLDFGLNTHPTGGPSGTVKVAQRIVMNFYTAKRLLQALAVTVQRHEDAFGVLETDVNKRVRPERRPAE